MTANEIRTVVLAALAEGTSDLSEEACRSLLELGWDLGRQSAPADENPFRRKPGKAS